MVKVLHPNFRKLGAGKLLAREVTKRALARGDGQFVMLVGDRDYYCPLGWEPTTLGNIEFPGPVDPTRVLLFADPTIVLRCEPSGNGSTLHVRSS